MEFKCLGSSSLGNSYILTDKNGYSLVIECGVHLKTIKKALGYDITKVVAAIVSHTHG
jgi:glyoxylase-like metal-dependent hydrolase (beta-lactamase superfamily II)